MYTTLHCVALRTIRHNDCTSILTAWSREQGRVSLIMPSGNGAESRRRRALTGALALFECEADMRPGQELSRVKDLRPIAVNSSLATGPVHAAVAMFLAEVTGSILREGAPDAVLWDIIARLILQLNKAEGRALANFHLYYLAVLGRVLGIAPDVATWRRGMSFDLIEGCFMTTPPLHGHFLDPRDAHMMRMLLDLASRCVNNTASVVSLGHLRLTRLGRARALDIMLQYFNHHYAPLPTPSSLAVLRML
ncbi:MAG: recombination protein O N-terminal domain-containing protein [Muribaculaceae bacterium]|nr:recombination protein O N-terminal domain-containing protein [Muribaculaceae bacterium]